MISAAGFIPAEDGAGLIAICPCVFRNEAAMIAALASPESKWVMDDVMKVTNVVPHRSVAKPV